ncbi:hypothetical protein COB18_00070 [Candidatus Kaiserbacteria bacterium]|nr:MAG: hypothetical protein COB18_00070 [Candidatus Kaiserbacteria bacterium]
MYRSSYGDYSVGGLFLRVFLVGAALSTIVWGTYFVLFTSISGDTVWIQDIKERILQMSVYAHLGFILLYILVTSVITGITAVLFLDVIDAVTCLLWFLLFIVVETVMYPLRLVFGPVRRYILEPLVDKIEEFVDKRYEQKSQN